MTRESSGAWCEYDAAADNTEWGANVSWVQMRAGGTATNALLKYAKE